MKGSKKLQDLTDLQPWDHYVINVPRSSPYTDQTCICDIKQYKTMPVTRSLLR